MNKTILKVIEQEYYDRYVFITYENDEIIGLNFHQGIGAIDYYFSKPCPHLTEIFKRLKNNAEYSKQDQQVIINKAIDLYIDTFIFQNESFYIPQEQTSIVKEALRFYYEQYKKFNAVPTDSENYKMFDLLTLEALMNYTIKVEMSQEEKSKFSSKNGIDLPIYNN